mgnify:CR=1 FL=1|jgi:hypothetical protein
MRIRSSNNFCCFAVMALGAPFSPAEALALDELPPSIVNKTGTERLRSPSFLNSKFIQRCLPLALYADSALRAWLCCAIVAGVAV